MIHKKITLLLTILSLSSSAFAANYYVSNDLFTYTHSGAGSKYKILGVVNAGQKIKVLSTNKKTGYTQIKDLKGRTVWINSKYVSNQPGLKIQLEKLKIQYSKLNEKLSNYENKANKNKLTLEKDLNSNINQVLKLKEINDSLSKELKEIKEENNSLNDLLDNEKNELLMRWFSYGGIVAGIGLLLGLILPSLIPSRKKKSRF
jgi:SH3 domain protein